MREQKPGEPGTMFLYNVGLDEGRIMRFFIGRSIDQTLHVSITQDGKLEFHWTKTDRGSFLPGAIITASNEVYVNVERR
jgi:hypothetical protein